MARCLAFSARAASAVFVVSVVISGFLPFVDGTDARKCGTRRLVQHLYLVWPGTLPPAYAAGHGDLISPVLPGGQGDGVAGRAVDAAHRPRARRRQRTLQRAAPRSAADVAHLAVQAAEPAGPGRRDRTARRRLRRPVRP